MRLLLDTHALLWFINGDTRLSDAARKVMDNDSVDIFLGAVLGDQRRLTSFRSDFSC
jgi:PIN domain nuclease of toxin-antitoxin system